MTIQAQETSVRSSVDVQAPIERAFRVFTEDIGSWWDPTHHILDGELAEMVFEPRVGGTSTTAESTAASAAGRGCSPTSRRTGS
jgi:hypothetical protein